MKLIAHRGARATAPENTLSAYRLGKTLPVQFVEGDVALTADNIPVMLHQETLQPDAAKRGLTLAPRDEGRSWLLENCWRDIEHMDAGSWFDKRFAAERIPTLQDVLGLGWSKPGLLLDLIDPYYWKDQEDRRMCEAFAMHVIPLVRSAIARSESISVLCFNPAMLEVWQQELPAVDRTLAVWTNYKGHEHAHIQRALDLKVSTVTIADFMLRDEPIWEREIRAAGLQLGVYELTPDSSHGFRAWTPEKRKPMWDLVVAKKVDVFTCDFPTEFCK